MKVEIETRSAYFESLAGFMSKDEVLEEFTNSVLSVEEMREIFHQRENERTHTCYDIELKVDDDTGLYYVNHRFNWDHNLLVNHLLLEQLFAHKDQVDWERVTDYYDYEVLEKIYHTLIHPLVWVPTEEVGDYCVVKGKAAKEVYPPDDYDDRGRYAIYYQLRKKGLLWFADNMPVINDVPFQDRYNHFPPDMILWDRLFEGSIKGVTPHDLQRNLENIVEDRGGAKAAEIVERLREDWKDIVALELFGINSLNEYEKGYLKRMEKFLFVELERYLRSWKAAAPHENEVKISENAASVQAEEELFRFIHPEVIDDEERRKVHLEVKYLVKNYPIPEIFNHLDEMAKNNRVYYKTLNHAIFRTELERLGLPDESQQGYSVKTFDKHFH